MGTKILKHPALNKKHSETVVFVHHMFGNYRTSRRHQLLVNKLGYDAVSFDLIIASNNHLATALNPLTLKIYRSVFEIWRMQIQEILDQVPGKKIIYAFSGPSLSALLAGSGRKDIIKIICDGGPFEDLEICTQNLFYFEKNITFKPANLLLSFLSAKLWGEKKAQKNIHSCLKQWNKEVPLLSIRGMKDHIVPIKSIDKIFQDHQNLTLDILTLEQGKHLDGLKMDKDNYTRHLEQFLMKQ